MATTKVSTGNYVTSTGYQVQKVVDWDNRGMGEGWNLIDPEGHWCNTFATKRDAVAASERIDAENGA